MTDFDRWYAGKSFTTDWTSTNFQTWTRFIVPDDVRGVLEIGSWEGRSAIFFLEFCPRCDMTSIDTFAGGQERAGMEELGEVELRFDSNLAPYGGRVEKIRSRSVPALDRLGSERRRFDIVYIDGSHERDDVVLDSFLAWRLLKQDGLLIWDDYRWRRDLPERDRPERAIDVFLELHAGELEILHMAGQVLARRRALTDRPKPLPGMTIPRNLRNLHRFALGLPITDLRTKRTARPDARGST